MMRENQALTSKLIDRQLDDNYEENDAYDISDDSNNYMILLMSYIHYLSLLYSLYVAVIFTICRCYIHLMDSRDIVDLYIPRC